MEIVGGGGGMRFFFLNISKGLQNVDGIDDLCLWKGLLSINEALLSKKDI